MANKWTATKSFPGPIPAYDGTSLFMTGNIGPSKFKQDLLNNQKVMHDSASILALEKNKAG